MKAWTQIVMSQASVKDFSVPLDRLDISCFLVKFLKK